MDVRAALSAQYHASLAMLRQAITDCPDALWTATVDALPYWGVAYHALFFTDFYALPGPDALVPWELHRHEAVDGHGEPYTRAQVLDYWQRVEDGIDAAIERLDLDAAECGFPWYQMPKLEHQLLNLRHTQHHIGVLSDRLRQATGHGLDWR